MQLFLIRHGDVELEADSDALRMLSSRGKAEVWSTARALLPDADVSQALDLLEACRADSVLVVSHNPLVSRLLSLLVQGSSNADRYLDTSQLVCVETDLPAPGCGVIQYELLP